MHGEGWQRGFVAGIRVGLKMARVILQGAMEGREEGEVIDCMIAELEAGINGA